MGRTLEASESLKLCFNTTCMPTPLGDTIPSISIHSQSTLHHSQRLPLHHDSQFPHAQELDDLAPSSVGQRRNRSDSISLEDTPEDTHLLTADSSDEEEEDDPSMGTKSRRPRSKEPKGSSSSATGGENGHLNGSMNNNVEYRRKNASMESPVVTSNLMARESFTLDDHVPKTPTMNNHGFFELPMSDRRNFGLLVLLYFLQGVPMGLATGSVPFLLKPYMSYSALGVFSLASYPYSVELESGDSPDGGSSSSSCARHRILLWMAGL